MCILDVSLELARLENLMQISKLKPADKAWLYQTVRRAARKIALEASCASLFSVMEGPYSDYVEGKYSGDVSDEVYNPSSV